MRRRPDVYGRFLIIASAIPYVDAIVTESHLADGLRKTKRLDDFIEHLTIHTLRDFRHSAPEAASLNTVRFCGGVPCTPGIRAQPLD